MSGTDFLNRSGERVPLSRAVMRDIVQVLLESEDLGGAEVSVLFCNDAEMRRLNRDFRGIDKSTDVLSFPQDGPSMSGAATLLGDVAVCLPACRRQAARLGHSAARELAFLLLHGFLHLRGYDHDEHGERRWRKAELRLGRIIAPHLPPGWDGRALGLLGG